MNAEQIMIYGLASMPYKHEIYATYIDAYIFWCARARDDLLSVQTKSKNK